MKKNYFYGIFCRYFMQHFVVVTKKKIAHYFNRLNTDYVLDFCTSTGLQLALLKKQNIKCVGFDLNNNLLRYNTTYMPGLQFVCADASKVPFKNGSFQGISFAFALHDKNKQLRDAMICEAKRLLAPGGKIIAADFVVPWNLCSRTAYLLTFFIELCSGHFTLGIGFIKEGGLHALLQKHGLTILQQHPIYWRNSAFIIAEVTDDATGNVTEK